MCGIAGIFGEFSDKVSQLDEMLDVLNHRGPDDVGVYSDEIFTGGMRRLSINGLGDGSQPLYNNDKSVIVFYNGEIYNSRALKLKLEIKGKKFRTHSDGEVIAHLYDDIGESVFEQLDGMFAIAIWDTRRRILILARDIAGEKPLYYSRLKNKTLVFASEVKALECVSSLSLTLNRQAIWDFPSFLWIPEPRTAYNEIEALPRGHFMIASERNVSIRPYDNIFRNEKFSLSSDEDAIKITRDIVTNSVKSRLLSDVPVGAFLSGGLDSSIIATIAAKELPSLDTFTVSFEDVNDPYHGRADESEAAAITASIIGSRHHTISVTAGSFRKNIDKFCKFGDQPFSVSSGLGILAIAEASAEAGIKVLLSGDGADECFGGYSWYEYLATHVADNNVNENMPISFQNIGLPITERLNALSKMTPSHRAWAWHYYAHESEKLEIFNREWCDDLYSSLSHFDSVEKFGTAEEYIRHDRNFYFPNEMLRKVDRMTMAYSVEGRTPFASARILALADKLPLKHMVRGKDLKWVLRRAFENILPMDVINRPKHGFNVPIDHWLKGEWSDMVDEAFEAGSALHTHGIVSKDSLNKARKLLSDKNRLNGHTIFSFIMLNKWLSQ